MVLEDVRQFEPLWGKWFIVERLGGGSYGDVYKIKREEYGEVYYSAMKIISIPKDREELNQASLSCGTVENTRTYFDHVRQSIVKEIRMMERFKGKTNIVSYEDHDIQPKNGGQDPGYDIFIRMELLDDLNNVAAQRPGMFRDNKEIVRLGRDICQALKVCHAQNVIHRDIKLGNIFLSEDGDYKLGDFGIARSFDSSSLTMSVRGTFDYMAPEVYNREHYDFRADIYSLGMVMYHMLNAFRGPFLRDFAGVPSALDKEQALVKRMLGEKLPYPKFAQGGLAEAVLKACAFRPEERYADAEAFAAALESLGEEDLSRSPRRIAGENLSQGSGQMVGKPEVVSKEELTTVLQEEDGTVPMLFEEKVNEWQEEDGTAPFIPNDIVQKGSTPKIKPVDVPPIQGWDDKESQGNPPQSGIKPKKWIIMAITIGMVAVIGSGTALAIMSQKKDADIGGETANPALQEAVTAEPLDGEVQDDVPTDSIAPEDEKQATNLQEDEEIGKTREPLPSVGDGVQATALKEGQPLSESKLSAVFTAEDSAEEIPGYIKWVDEDLEVGESGEYEWVFQPDDQTAYEVAAGTAWVTALISDTVVGVDGIEAINDKKALLDVDLSGCGLTDLSILEGADNLEFLALDENKLESLEVLKKCKNLRFVSLNGNKELSDITPLLKLKKLEAVFLEDTQVSKKDKDKVEAILAD